MMYESAQTFGADHPRLFKRLQKTWKDAMDGIQSIFYEKNRGMIVEVKTTQHLNEFHVNRPKVKNLTLHYHNTSVDTAYERRRAYNLAASNGATDKSSVEIASQAGVAGNRYFRRSVAEEAIKQAQKGDPNGLVKGLIKAFNR